MSRRGLSYLVFAFIGIHVFMSFLFTAPEQYRPDKGYALSEHYIYPFFYQNWKLFAPEVPSDNYEISVLTQDGREIDLIDHFSRRHKETRVLYHGSIALALYNWSSYLHAERQRIEASGYYSSNSYPMISRLVRQIDLNTEVHEITFSKNGELFFITND